jgi:hypothetical protein
MTETPTPPAGRALLIGVEHYPHHHGKDLRAGRNDVLAFWKVCRRLGYPPQDIRVLTSPPLEMQDLVWAEIELLQATPPSEGAERDQLEETLRHELGRQGVAPDVAERRSILAGAKWLAEGLAQRGDDGELPSLPGLFTFSGHGAQRGGELVLCPSDTGKIEGGGLSNAVTLRELGAIFAEADADKTPGTPSPTDNLTVVLDCCFAASGVAREGQLVPTLSAGAGGGAGKTRTEIGNRVFCASGPDSPSYQAMLGGYWYSAFTWALTVSLEQWKTDMEGPYAESTVSHNELLFRARTLMRALGLRQHPVFEDGEGRGNQRVFHHGASPALPAKGSPDAPRLHGQLQPDCRYALVAIPDRGGPEFIVAIVYVLKKGQSVRFNNGVTTTCPTDGADTEYWWVSNYWADLSSYSKLRIEMSAVVDDAESEPWGGRGLEFESRVGDGVPWSSTPTRYLGTSHYYQSGPLALQIVTDGASFTGFQWWYYGAGFSGVIGLSSRTECSRLAGPPAGESWVTKISR